MLGARASRQLQLPSQWLVFGTRIQVHERCRLLVGRQWSMHRDRRNRWLCLHVRSVQQRQRLPNDCNLRLPRIALHVWLRQFLRCRELPHRFGLRYQRVLFSLGWAVGRRLLLSHPAGHLHQRRRLPDRGLPEHSGGAKVCLFWLRRALAVPVCPDSRLNPKRGGLPSPSLDHASRYSLERTSVASPDRFARSSKASTSPIKVGPPSDSSDERRTDKAGSVDLLSPSPVQLPAVPHRGRGLQPRPRSVRSALRRRVLP